MGSAEIMPWLTPGALAAAMPQCKAPGAWVAPLRATCARFKIATPLRLAAFLAQAGHESGSLNRLSESLDYSPAGLMATWPNRFPASVAHRLGRIPGRPAAQEAIAEIAYGKRMGNVMPGDAWRFRGAGIFQVTGWDNHNRAAQFFGMATDEMPDWLRTMEGAALSAGWFWNDKALSPLADLGAIDAISRRVNGGDNGLADRRERYIRARAVLA